MTKELIRERARVPEEEAREAGGTESAAQLTGGLGGRESERELFLAHYADLVRGCLEGKKSRPGALASLVEEWASRDPGALEVMERLRQSVEAPIREKMETLSSHEERLRLEKAILEAKGIFLEACLRGCRKRIARIAEKWKRLEDFPDTLAAVLDPLTLAREALERLKDLLGLEKATLLELDRQGRLVPVAGDKGGNSAPLVLKGEAAARFLEERKAITSQLLGESDVVFPGGEWEGGALIPLVVRQRVIGGLFLRGFAAQGTSAGASLDMETAERFAKRLAVAWENARLHQREQKKIRETLALLEIARVVGSTLDPEEILNRVVEMVLEVCPVTFCAAFLCRDGIFRPLAWRGFIDELAKELEGVKIDLDSLGEEARKAIEEGRAVTLSADAVKRLLPGEALAEHGVEEVLLQPLRARGRTVGFLALFHAGHPDIEESWEEKQLAEAVALQASLAVENASLYADIERGYFSTVQALAKAIEVKDPYTRGHSERVTTYALMIAEAMGLDEREKQKLKYAATLHDIGKIGIAGRVLNKPGALTEEEYTHVKTHPILGDSIVEPVEFLQEPRPIILHHHERYDGKGYPEGLKGEDIPLCARILSVADAFEAMRSDRPYRKALPLDEARMELVRNAGTQFDPRVVEVFLGILDRHGGDPIPRGEGGSGERGQMGPPAAGMGGERSGAPREAGGTGR
ncbi:MAG: HD domain-containing protein [Actinobacteria bacterium]|nr:HD domain-containing protein [Actinomycetota bacterium]